MSWLKKGGSFIQSVAADDMIARYQKSNPDKIRAVYFDKDALTKLLSADKAAGLSIYFARNEDGTDTVVLKAVDEEGNIIKTVEPLEVGNPCPPYCAK